jgi:hypothetical protein
MKKLVATLFVATVGASGGALYLWRQLQAERSRVADLEARLQDVESLQGSIAALASRLSPGASNVEAPADNAPDQPELAAERQPGIERTDTRVGSALREALRNPEARNLTRGIRRTLLEQRYPGLAAELNLSPEQADQLFDLLSQQQTELREGVRDLAGRSDGSTTSVQDLQRMADERRRATEKEMAALLGSKYPQWQEYERTQPARQQVSQLQSVLASEGTKLTDAQSGPLISALAAEQQRIDQENLNALAATTDPQQYRQQQLQRASDNNRRLVTAATPYLTPQQLDSYQKMLERQQNTASRVIDALGARRGQVGGQAPP